MANRKAIHDDTGSDVYINEDMTFLQRKLFKHLRSKENILLKRSVGFKDGRFVFLLKKNETTKHWSKVDNILNLAKVDADLEIDVSDNDTLTGLGLADCIVDVQ